jgi:hypothetical protein
MMSTQLDAAKTAGTSPPVVADDLITTIKLFGVSGSAVEIRIPDAGRDGTVSGYFNLAKKAVRAASEMAGKARGRKQRQGAVTNWIKFSDLVNPLPPETETPA